MTLPALLGVRLRTVASILAWLALPSVAEAVCPTPTPDWTVCAAGCTHTTIAAALGASSSGQTICVQDPGNYPQALNFNARSVTLAGSVPGVVVTTGAGSEMVTVTSATVRIQDLEILGSAARRCVLVNSGGNLTLERVRIHACTQGVDGAAIYLQQVQTNILTLVDSEVDHNGDGTRAGGAIGTDRATAVNATRTSFHDNRGTDGAAIRLVQTPGTFVDCTFTANLASVNGGAIRSSDTAVDVTGGAFTQNTAVNGGGISHSGSGDVTLDGTLLDRNTATGDGGGVQFAGADTFTVLASRFVGNLADRDANNSGNGGGAWAADGSVLDVAATVFEANAAYHGGGVYSAADDATVSACDFLGNDGNGDAGGLYLWGAGAGSLVRNTAFAGNTCTSLGGGLRTFASTFVAVNNVFVDNDCTGADDGDGLYEDGGSVTFRNNIVALHADEGARVAGGGAFDPSYNDWFGNGENLATGAIDATDLTSDPDLVSWVDDGVFDDNLLVDPGSPCIDAGDPGILDLDGTRSDIGLGGGPGGRDLDEDGWPSPLDCDDGDDLVHPGATEGPGDGFDQDCDGQEACWLDQDGDGEGDPLATVQSDDFACLQPGESPTDVDCDDSDDTVFSAAVEGLADGVDQDCDGRELCYTDADSDTFGGLPSGLAPGMSCAVAGFSAFGNDCGPNDPNIRPSATETVNDGIDQDCDGVDTCYQDQDNDNAGVNVRIDSADLDCADAFEAVNNNDCNDANAAVRPGATEVVNDGIDQDCDLVDSCYQDADNDDFGAPFTIDSLDLDCADAFEATNTLDCNDGDAGITPLTPEIVNDGIDQDCTGGDTCFQDQDDDNSGVPVVIASVDLDCNDAFEASVLLDCDDGDASVRPGATELVNDGIDQDCDAVDTCYEDLDDDGFGSTVRVDSLDLDCNDALEAPVAGDCDDADASANPSVAEIVADERDGDCDGEELCYGDGDGDGAAGSGTRRSPDEDCSDVLEFLVPTDCDDNDVDVFPGATEVPGNEVDDDCAGGELCFSDTDGDGYGVSATLVSGDVLCDAPGEATRDGDCDDLPGGDGVHPGAPEIRANGIDEDCNGGDLVDCYLDDDDDGYGVLVIVPFSGDCGPEPRLSDRADDCDDRDAGVNPGEPETLGDGVDSDCDLAGRPLDEDGDGVAFADEEVAGSSDATADSDADDVEDGPEIVNGIDPADPDSDDDGVPDGEEWGDHTGPPRDTDGDGDPDPVDPDDDDDTLPTDFETLFPDPDVDGDGLENWIDDDDDDDGVLTVDEDADGDGDLTNDDRDGDQLPDYLDDDDDNDGVPTLLEVLVGADPFHVDSDADGIGDGAEWPDTSNPAPDTDADGSPDLTDPDDDGDGIATAIEDDPGAPWLPDIDDDGVPNHLDDDSDGDGKSDLEEGVGDDDDDDLPNFADANDDDGCLGDDDQDGAPNCLDSARGRRGDPDADGDLVPDGVELAVPLTVDSDRDGIPDVPAFRDPAVDALLDLDQDGQSNALDPDDDGDGIPTREETGFGVVPYDEGTVCGPYSACDPNDCPDARIRFDVRGVGTVRCGDEERPLDVTTYPGFHEVSPVHPDGPDWAHRDLRGTSDEDGDCVVDDRDLVDSGPLGDLDGDGYRNDFECDGRPDWDPVSDDMDGDGVGDASEGERDTDGDRVPDRLDEDDDGDGVPTREEPGDTDGDGVPDALDLDSDDDGVSDADERGDLDCDGVLDRVDPVAGDCDARVADALEHVRQGCACDGSGAGGLAGLLGALAVVAGRRRSDPVRGRLADPRWRAPRTPRCEND